MKNDITLKLGRIKLISQMTVIFSRRPVLA
jgi:hypothetical protein